MWIKSRKGQAYGADLTSTERKAIEMEIKRQLAEYERKHLLEIDALILWQLHTQLGFGVGRLRRFYDNFAPEMESMIARYELESEDSTWLCTQKLKEMGIDLEEWSKK